MRVSSTKEILLYGLLFAVLFTLIMYGSSVVFGQGFHVLAILICAIVSFYTFITTQFVYRKLNQS